MINDSCCQCIHFPRSSSFISTWERKHKQVLSLLDKTVTGMVLKAYYSHGSDTKVEGHSVKYEWGKDIWVEKI